MQKYILVPMDKTIDDLAVAPTLAALYCDAQDDVSAQYPDHHWIVNDTARLLELNPPAEG